MDRATARDDPELVRRTARESDPDRYLAALFAPPDARPHLFALIAFNAELARIPDAVREPILGQMRLAWWREAIGSRGAEGEASPVAAAVRKAAEARRLSVSRLVELIDAREFDLTGDVMPDRQALFAYLGKTDGALFALASEALGGEARQIEPAATASGRAYGLTGVLGNLHRDAARGRVFLPADDLARFGLAAGDLAGPSLALGPLLREMAALARAALDDARREVARLGRQQRVAFAPLALVEPRLRLMERSSSRPGQDAPRLGPLRRLWHIARAAATGRAR